jgi:Lsr2
MAKVTTVQIIDDIDGTPSPDAATVTFSIEGDNWEIDLGPGNAEALRNALAPYIENGRPVRTTTTTARKAKNSSAGGPSPDAVRTWAQAQGIQVAARGRISAHLQQQYLDATGA